MPLPFAHAVDALFAFGPVQTGHSRRCWHNSAHSLPLAFGEVAAHFCQILPHFAEIAVEERQNVGQAGRLGVGADGGEGVVEMGEAGVRWMEEETWVREAVWGQPSLAVAAFSQCRKTKFVKI